MIESRWHTDVTFMPNPPMASILRGLVVPPYGGDTQWTNLVTAYEQLSPQVQDLIDGLHAVHHNDLPILRGEMSGELAKQFPARPIRSVHPVVRVHPETGERGLFVSPNFTSHIVELSRKEGRHVLALLYEQLVNPAYTVRFRWEPGSIAFWDNRAPPTWCPPTCPRGCTARCSASPSPATRPWAPTARPRTRWSAARPTPTEVLKAMSAAAGERRAQPETPKPATWSPAVWPPSIGTSAPVTMVERSLARNSATEAISSVVASRGMARFSM